MVLMGQQNFSIRNQHYKNWEIIPMPDETMPDFFFINLASLLIFQHNNYK
jgi:hypothetical protein